MAVSRARQSGAALLAVLVVSVVLVTLLASAALIMDNRLQLAEQARQQFTDGAAAYAKTNELIYLLATQRLTVAGISQGSNQQGLQRNEDGQFIQRISGDEWRTDGFIYEEGNIQFSIQNENGLLPVNSAFQYWLKRWLQNKGYSNTEQAFLTDRLADYADADDWHRAGGAERRDYERLGKRSPANFLLQQCAELYLVDRWPPVIEKHPAILGHCSLRRSPQLNINAVPLSLWQVLWPASAEKVAAARAAGDWVVHYQDAYKIEPTLLLESEDRYSPLGGDRFVLSVKAPGTDYRLSIERGTKNARPFTQRVIF